MDIHTWVDACVESTRQCQRASPVKQCQRIACLVGDSDVLWQAVQHGVFCSQSAPRQAHVCRSCDLIMDTLWRPSVDAEQMPPCSRGVYRDQPVPSDATEIYLPCRGQMLRACNSLLSSVSGVTNGRRTVQISGRLKSRSIWKSISSSNAVTQDK